MGRTLRRVRKWIGECVLESVNEQLVRVDGPKLVMVEHRTVTPLSQVRFPGAARGFLPRVIFQCRLSLRVHTPPCAIPCITTYVHIKDPVVHVRVRWIMGTQTYPVRIIATKISLMIVLAQRKEEIEEKCV